jgi:hypothetical protein
LQFFEDSAKPDAIKRKISNGEQTVKEKNIVNFSIGDGWVEAQVQGDMPCHHDITVGLAWPDLCAHFSTFLIEIRASQPLNPQLKNSKTTQKLKKQFLRGGIHHQRHCPRS